MIFAIRAAVRVKRSLLPCPPPRSSGVRSTLAWVRALSTTKYTAEHERVAYDDQTGVGTVSITNHAQASLGDVVFVELPNVGTEVKMGDQIGAVESVKAASDIYAPVSGKVVEVNDRLSSEPGLLNRAPEADGWLCRIQLSEPNEIETLLTEEGYKDACESS